MSRSAPADFLHGFGELREDFEDVADDAVGGDLEDRGFGVFVDGDDDLGRRHAGEVLDRAGDAAGDVEARRDDLAGLADLVRVADPPRVDDRARRADGAAERLGEVADQGEVLGRFQSPAAADDDRRLGDVLLGRGGSRQPGDLARAATLGAATATTSALRPSFTADGKTFGRNVAIDGRASGIAAHA